MTQTRERVEPQNVSLYPSDWAIVDEADEQGKGRSAALRKIVREWQEHQEEADDLDEIKSQLQELRERLLVDSKVRYDAGCADG